jgi:hypothetical protein
MDGQLSLSALLVDIVKGASMLSGWGVSVFCTFSKGTACATKVENAVALAC